MTFDEALSRAGAPAIARHADLYREPESAPEFAYGTRSQEVPDWDDEREAYMVESAAWPSLDEQIAQEDAA